jgi:hypothetical protein
VKKFCSTEEVQAARLPPWQHEAVAEAVNTMEKLFGHDYDPAKGFVVLVEEGDTPEDAVPVVGYPLGSKLETTRRRHGCLVGLTLWGNSGDGVTWICPERPGYAARVQELLRREL